MKESAQPRQKKRAMRVVSQGEMTSDQQSRFDQAIDALLADLVSSIDRRNQGEDHGSTEKSVAGAQGDRRRPSE